MTWGNTLRAAVSGLTSLYPAVLSPLNAVDNFGQADTADGLGRLSTAIDSLRSVSWHSNELTIAADEPILTGGATNSWTRGNGTVTIDGVSCNLPFWETITGASPNDVLLYGIPHPRLANVYLSGYTIMSSTAAGHSSVPSSNDRFRAALIEYRAGSTNLYRTDQAADGSSVAAYDAAQDYRVTIAAGSALRPQLNQYRYALALRAETGGFAVLGRRVRGVLFHFSKDA